MKWQPNLVSPPVLLTGDEKTKRVSWLELFYDLVFVVTISQLASQLSEQYTLPGFTQFLILAVPTWWAWVGQAFYMTRFESPDLVHRLLTLVQMFGVVSMAVAVPVGFTEDGWRFAASYAMVRTMLVIQYTRAGHHNPEARPLTLTYSAGFSLSILLFLVSIAVPTESRPAVWVVAILLDILTPFAAGTKQIRFRPHMSHLPERFGLFTIIVIGEAILSVATGMGKSKLEPLAIVAAIAAWITAGSIFWAYFEGVRGAEERAPTDRFSARTYRIWLYSHLPLTLGIVASAIGLKHVIGSYYAVPLPMVEVWILVLSQVSIMALLQVIALTVPTVMCSLQYRKYLRPHGVTTTFGLLGLPLGAFYPGWTVAAYLALVWVVHVVLSHRLSPEAGEGVPEPDFQ